MFAIGRRNLLLGASALGLLGLAACDGANGSAGVSADDMVIGPADARVAFGDGLLRARDARSRRRIAERLEALGCGPAGP